MLKRLLWQFMQLLPEELKTQLNVKRREKFWKAAGVLFVHVPKAAGTSISHSLYGRSLGHIAIKDIRECSSREIEGLFSFAFVRNPWDRAVSAYHFARDGGSDGAGITNKSIYVGENFSSFRSFCEWLKSQDVKDLDPVFKTQCSYVLARDGELGVDYIGKIENLDDDLLSISKTIGKKITIGKKNASSRTVYHDYYDSDELIELIGEIYRDDVETFGYTFYDSKMKARF